MVHTADVSPLQPLRALGEWRRGESSGLPDPSDLVDPSFPVELRAIVANYLDQGLLVAGMMGPDVCRICGESLIGDMLTDGVFCWRRSLSHYVGVHSVRLPDDFCLHAVEYLGNLAEAPTDDGWWLRSATRIAAELRSTH